MRRGCHESALSRLLVHFRSIRDNGWVVQRMQKTAAEPHTHVGVAFSLTHHDFGNVIDWR